MNSRRTLAVVVTHPVQYLSPLFRKLAEQIDLTVFYAHRPNAAQQGYGFGVPFKWDVDLTSGYTHVWLNNTSAAPSASTFRGCDTPEIGNYLRKARPSALLVAGRHSLTYWQAMFAAWRNKIPVIVRGDSQLVGDRPFTKSLAKELLYPIFIRRFSACLSVGIRSKEYFHHYGARRIFDAPHFIDNEFFARNADRQDRTALRAGFGIPPEALVVLFSGKLIPMKRPLDVVDAMSKVKAGPIHFLVAGDGELRAPLREAAARFNVNVVMPEMVAGSEAIAQYHAAAKLASEKKEAARIKAQPNILLKRNQK